MKRLKDQRDHKLYKKAKHDNLRYKKDKSNQMLTKWLKTKKTERDKIDKNCKFDHIHNFGQIWFNLIKNK